jgi:hypothetical protein
MTAAEGYDQGTWKRVGPEPRPTIVRRDARSGRAVIDIAAFKRLLKSLGADVGERLADAEKRQKKKAK